MIGQKRKVLKRRWGTLPQTGALTELRYAPTLILQDLLIRTLHKWSPIGPRLLFKHLAQRHVKGGGGVFLLPWQQVGVDIQRHRRVRVPCPGRDDMHRNPAP